MYNAIISQLKDHNRASFENAKALRVKLSELLLKESNEFLAFVAEDMGIYFFYFYVSLQESYKTYCEKLRSTREWGGQIELRALTMLLKSQIYVFRYHAVFL